MIAQTVEISLTQCGVPPMIHVKQHDNMGRRLCCSIYDGNEKLKLSSDMILNVTGTKPNGEFYQYSTESNPDIVYTEDGNLIICVTGIMTNALGRTAVDVTFVSDSGGVVGAFPFIIETEKSIRESDEPVSSYSGLMSMLSLGIAACTIDDDGYLNIESDVGLSFSMDDEGYITIRR